MAHGKIFSRWKFSPAQNPFYLATFASVHKFIDLTLLLLLNSVAASKQAAHSLQVCKVGSQQTTQRRVQHDELATNGKYCKVTGGFPSSGSEARTQVAPSTIIWFAAGSGISLRLARLIASE